MNRLLAIALSLLVLWSGSAYGLAGVCCCTDEVGGLSERVDDNCESSRHNSGNLRSMAHHNASDQCFLAHCSCQSRAFGLSEFESVLPEHQAVALPMTLVSSEGFFQASPPISTQIYTVPPKPLNLLLRTCSFLF